MKGQIHDKNLPAWANITHDAQHIPVETAQLLPIPMVCEKAYLQNPSGKPKTFVIGITFPELKTLQSISQ